jgi:hypothetical protein
VATLIEATAEAMWNRQQERENKSKYFMALFLRRRPSERASVRTYGKERARSVVMGSTRAAVAAHSSHCQNKMSTSWPDI